ncbi:MAG TPA: tRNA cytidylyltransferase, partial [Polyangia bacterium]|nr:tRNA cytidylyltransferase [Polyangia bacterium]
MTAPPALAAQIPADVGALARRLCEHGFQALLVGGGVRDMLLGRAPADFDLATDARPEKVLEIFGLSFAIPTGLQHGTVTVLTGPDAATRRSVEVTTFRGE